MKEWIFVLLLVYGAVQAQDNGDDADRAAADGDAAEDDAAAEGESAEASDEE